MTLLEFCFKWKIITQDLSQQTEPGYTDRPTGTYIAPVQKGQPGAQVQILTLHKWIWVP
jgi:hypothetical protein